MKKTSNSKKLLLGSALAGLVVSAPGVAVHSASQGGFFQTISLSSGYRLAQAESHEAKDAAVKADGKKSDAEKKSADHSCGAHDKTGDKSCGGKKDGDKSCGSKAGEKSCGGKAGDKSCGGKAGDKSCGGKAGDKSCGGKAGDKSCGAKEKKSDVEKAPASDKKSDL